jgi:hypothetical protein
MEKILFSGKFLLLSFTKKIHSKFRGNFPLKTEKNVPKNGGFFPVFWIFLRLKGKTKPQE